MPKLEGERAEAVVNVPSTGAVPPAFLWGLATSAYQVEGAAFENGRGESIWDRFCRLPGTIKHGDDGDISTDHYHRFRDDVRLMSRLGLGAYRFSVAWPRVIPSGRGPVNAPGLDFYDELVDELLLNDIQPFVTLYHWDLPQPLESAGGWLNRATVDSFVEYVEVVARRLGDRVRMWTTQNEPRISAWYGYGLGIHAPGRNDGESGAIRAAHNMLLSHGAASAAIRRDAPGSQVGISHFLSPTYPASEDPRDLAAAQQIDAMFNRWFLDPVLRCEYPADMLDQYSPHLPPTWADDLKIIGSRPDFLGVNYYYKTVVRAGDDGKPEILRPDGACTDIGTEISPGGLLDLLKRLSDDYVPRSIYITENGASFPDVRVHDGRVRDTERQEFLADHIGAMTQAIEAGVPVLGYFAWSLLDSFEWNYGYSARFGLVYVDYATQERVPKDSFHWYRRLIAPKQSHSA